MGKERGEVSALGRVRQFVLNDIADVGACAGAGFVYGAIGRAIANGSIREALVGLGVIAVSGGVVAGRELRKKSARDQSRLVQ